MADDASSTILGQRYAQLPLLLMCLYPVWSIVIRLGLPTEFDDPAGRIAVAAVGLVAYLALRLRPSLERHTHWIVTAVLSVLSMHFYWVVARSQLSQNYVLGVTIVTATAGLTFDRIRTFLVYMGVNVALATMVGLRFGMTPRAALMLAMVVTIHVVLLFETHVRTRAIRHLRDARLQNAEFSRALLQKELDSARAESAHLLRAAFRDPVSDSPNRSYLEKQVHQAIARHRQEGVPFALLYIDLDDFKPVNDRHGHATGDRTLATAASRLRDILRRSDLLARIGGDEFVALLLGVEPDADLSVLRRKVAEALQKPMFDEGPRIVVGASLGVAFCPSDGTRLDDLLHAADQRMYEDKRARKADRAPA